MKSCFGEICLIFAYSIVYSSYVGVCCCFFVAVSVCVSLSLCHFLHAGSETASTWEFVSRCLALQFNSSAVLQGLVCTILHLGRRRCRR